MQQVKLDTRQGDIVDIRSEPVDFQIRFPANPAAVRGVMAAMCRKLRQKRICSETRGKIELAVTEALNNIVLHAYRGRAQGDIELVACISAARLSIVIEDQGRRLPDILLKTSPHIPKPDPASLPESGFGWPMIRSLAHDIRHTRQDGANSLLLEFRIDTGQSAQSRRKP